MAEGADMLGLLTSARADSDVIARGSAPIRYGEFVARVKAWRAHFRCRAGSAYALYLEDGGEFAAALFGAWQANKIVYLPGDNLPGTCASVAARVDGFVGQFDARVSPSTPEIEDGKNDPDDFQRPSADVIGLVLFTSGTTGAAQAIEKKLGQLAREVATLEKEFGRQLQDAEIVATVSHQHIYGLLFRVLWPLAAGRVWHTRSYPYFEALAEILSARPCALVSSPAHLTRLPDHLQWSRARAQLRALFSSGGPLPFAAAQSAQRLLGSLPIEVYGSSETGGIAWRQQSNTDEAWQPFPELHWRVEAEEGVLEVQSPNLPDDSWFRMADRVEDAGAGRFSLRGRVDRIAKVEGKRISLGAIERLLATSPWVAEARVMVLEEQRQRVAAFVVLTAEGRTRLADVGRGKFNRFLAAHVATHVEAVGIPRLWRYLEALPVNAQGKTTQAELFALIKSSAVTQPRERIIEQNADRVVLELVAPKDLIYFNGHFEGTPLLAGVVQVDWVIACGRRCFDLPPRFRGMQALKFHRIITPEMPFQLVLTFERAKLALAFKITSLAGLHASGRILFGAADV